MKTVVSSSFDIAIWFLDKARIENTYLQPRVLQSILFLAQGIYASQQSGKLLMPSLFVMDKSGPIDPNLYRAFENGRPAIEVSKPENDIAMFLEKIWLQFGQKDAVALEQWIMRRAKTAGEVTIKDGQIIGFGAIRRLFGDQTPKTTETVRRSKPDPEKISAIGSTVLSNGRAVTVKKWVPGSPVSENQT